jgi:Putative Flp pilus-assembly TadE/G-like
MGFAALAIDVGFLEYRQRQQQNATDAAAVGGAQALVYVGCNSEQSVAQTAGRADAASNGFADQSSTSGPISVTINNPPNSGPYAGNNCAVQAVINNSATQTFFSRIFGYASMPETTQAVAVSANSSPLCAVQLGSNQTPTFHGNKISAAGCSLEMNGSPDFDGGRIDFQNIGYAGGSITENGTKWVEASPEPSLPVADPCPEIAGCRYLANNPPSTSNCGTAAVSNGAIGPGCYSSVPGGVSTLNPGLYVFTGDISLGGVTGNGVTIYQANGSFSMSGNGGSLSACTTTCGGTSSYMAVPNVLFYQPASNTNGVGLGGPQFTFGGGLVYAPSADLTIDGNGGSGYTLFVFNDWTINGTGSGMTFTAPAPGQSLTSQAVLVQ